MTMVSFGILYPISSASLLAMCGSENVTERTIYNNLKEIDMHVCTYFNTVQYL